MLPSFPMDITNEGQREGGGVGTREEKVSIQTKSPLSPLIRFFYQNGLKHRTLGIFSFLQEASQFNPTVGSPGLTPHLEVGAKRSPAQGWGRFPPLHGPATPSAPTSGRAPPPPLSLGSSSLKWGDNSGCPAKAVLGEQW